MQTKRPLMPSHGRFSGVASGLVLACAFCTPALQAQGPDLNPANSWMRPGIVSALDSPQRMDASELRQAPRIVATQDGRTLIAQGDRVYVRGLPAAPLGHDAQSLSMTYTVLREIRSLTDPVTGEVKGVEVAAIGQAWLVRGESSHIAQDSAGNERTGWTPATVDIARAREEIRVGDRLLPERAPTPRHEAALGPTPTVEARIVAVLGTPTHYLAQNQMVVIDRGRQHGLERGHVLVILKAGRVLKDPTEPSGTALKLPDERGGRVWIYHSYDTVSHALVLDTTQDIHVGDRLVNPL